MEGGLTGDGLFRPNLSLSDTQQIFFFLLIDFDLPTIEVSLKNWNDIGSRIGNQQVSRLAVEAMPMSAIGQRRDDDQAQREALSTTTPEQWADGFVAELMRASDGKDGSALPGNGVVLTHLFGCPQILAVDAPPAAARLSFRQRGEVDVFTRASDQYGALCDSAQHGAIAIAGIDNHPQDALSETGDGIQSRADLLNQNRSLSAEALLTAHGVILFPFGIRGLVSHVGAVPIAGVRDGRRCFLLFGFGYRRRQIESDRNGAGRTDAIDRTDQQYRLNKTQCPDQIRVVSGRQRIAQRRGIGNMVSGLTSDGVVQGDHHGLGFRPQFQAQLQDDVEQRTGTPAGHRKQLVIGSPALKLTLLRTDGPADGATPQAHQQRQCKTNGAPMRAVIRKTWPPPLDQIQELRQQLHRASSGSGISAKVFGAVRINRSCRATRLLMAETTDSRSNSTPNRFWTAAMMSVMWSGWFSRRSMSVTISIPEIRPPSPFMPGLDFPFGESRSRRIARNCALDTASRISSRSSRVLSAIQSSLLGSGRQNTTAYRYVNDK